MNSRVSLGGMTRSKRVFSVFIILFVLVILGTAEFAQTAESMVEIDEAAWESSDGELLLKGFSGPRALVSLADADSGATLAQVRANREEKWKVKLTDLAAVPCRVSATSGDSVAVAFVDRAPNCGPTEAPLGEVYYVDNLCYLCHGDDGSGTIGPDIRGEATQNEIRRAMANEEVHSGQALTDEEMLAIATFINNPVHDSTFAKDINGNDGYLASSEFCGSCHDVRTPPGPGLTTDPVTGKPFQRLENLFTEWQNGPFGPVNNTVGGVVSCQDCHMDAGPPAPAATYYDDKTSIFPRPRDANERDKVATHYFTGVDITLIDFPGQDDASKDEHGNNVGQIQRRMDLLESAATLSVTAQAAAKAGDTVPVTVDVTNVGSGHNIPSGFSQERQMWIEFTATDATGIILYQSGHLVDSAHPETGELVPDGNLDDEDLLNFVGRVDPLTGEVGRIDPITLEADLVHGPDYNERHGDHPVYKGLANFGNEFIRFDASGHEEEVFMPFLSEHTNNTFSIPPLETESVRYDIDIPASVTGPVEITARLRFRAFPPRFLRALAEGRPDLVTEEMVDRNRIVEMETAVPISIMISP